MNVSNIQGENQYSMEMAYDISRNSNFSKKLNAAEDLVVNEAR